MVHAILKSAGGCVDNGTYHTCSFHRAEQKVVQTICSAQHFALHGGNGIHGRFRQLAVLQSQCRQLKINHSIEQLPDNGSTGMRQ